MDTRADHLAWCKSQAIEFVNIGDVTQAFSSMCSDLNKHPETAGHIGIKLDMMELMSGHLSTPERMRTFINGFN